MMNECLPGEMGRSEVEEHAALGRVWIQRLKLSNLHFSNG